MKKPYTYFTATQLTMVNNAARLAAFTHDREVIYPIFDPILQPYLDLMRLDLMRKEFKRVTGKSLRIRKDLKTSRICLWRGCFKPWVAKKKCMKHYMAVRREAGR